MASLLTDPPTDELVAAKLFGGIDTSSELPAPAPRPYYPPLQTAAAWVHYPETSL